VVKKMTPPPTAASLFTPQPEKFQFFYHQTQADTHAWIHH